MINILGTSASLLVTSALLVVTRSYTCQKILAANLRTQLTRLTQLTPSSYQLPPTTAATTGTTTLAIAQSQLGQLGSTRSTGSTGPTTTTTTYINRRKQSARQMAFPKMTFVCLYLPSARRRYGLFKLSLAPCHLPQLYLWPCPISI